MPSYESPKDCAVVYLCRRRLLATNTSVVPSQMNTEDIWAATEGYRELCLIANQQYNALTADLGEKQRTVVEEVGSSRRRGSILASTATRLAKDMSVALEMLSDYHNKHDADEIATNCHASAGIPQPVQSIRLGSQLCGHQKQPDS